MINFQFPISNFQKIFCAIFLIGAVLFPLTVFAANLIPCGGPGEDACTFCDIFEMIDRVVDFLLFTMVPPLAALLLAVGGIMFFFSRAEPGMVNRGRSIMTSVVIGVLIVYTAFIMVSAFFALIGVANFSVGSWKIGTWFTIDCP